MKRKQGGRLQWRRGDFKEVRKEGENKDRHNLYRGEGEKKTNDRDKDKEKERE